MMTCPIPADRCGTCDHWHKSDLQGWGLCYGPAQQGYYGPTPTNETAPTCQSYRRRNVQRVSTCSRS